MLPTSNRYLSRNTEMTPLVSVVMPVRDGVRWLSEAIASVQAQVFSSFELVIVDDGSVDDTPKIIGRFAQADPRIVAFRQGKLGLVAALNLAASQSRGRLIARLDADDRMHPQRLDRQVQYLDAHPEIGLLGSWADKIDEHGTFIGRLTPETHPEKLKLLLRNGNPFVHSSVIVRSDIMKTLGYRCAFEAAEDYDLWLRMSEVTKIANMPECLVQYRLHETNVSHRSQARQLFSVRLAQAAAQARRNSGFDPAARLGSPPDWNASQTETDFYHDKVQLFRLIELADPAIARTAKISQLDLSPLTARGDCLSHAERRLAQLAVLNLMQREDVTGVYRAILLLNFIRLHPARAFQLGWSRLLTRSRR
jgi:glycosyltransferase involved in cell wall biosynthesis